MQILSKITIALAAAAILAVGYSTPTLAQERSKISTDRANLMKGMGGALRGVGGAQDAAAAVGPAKTIAANVEKLGGMWAEGTGGPNTRAKDEIWSGMDDFLAKFGALQQASAQLVSAAEGGNLDGVKAAFGAVRGTCGACHRVYRGPELK